MRNSVYCVVAVARIIVIGPPVSGKGSISKMICKTLGTEHITMDSILKEGDSTLAAEAQEYSSSGSAIPVDLFANLVYSRQVYQFLLYMFVQLCVEYLENNVTYDFLAVIFLVKLGIIHKN